MVGEVTNNQVGNVREDLRQLFDSLPKPVYLWVQELLTWMTGRPHQGQQPLFKRTRLGCLTQSLVLLFGGVAASCAILKASPIYLPLLPISWLITVGAARHLQTSICHQCIHSNFFHDYRDRLLTEAISTALLIQDFESYRYDHIKLHHHVEKFATSTDPDLRFLLTLGFKPGMPKQTYWQLLRRTVCSFHFHWLFLKDRIQTNFITAPLYRCLMTIFWTIFVVSVVTVTHSWFVFTVGLLFPLTFLYHISALLQFCCEHRWLLIESSSSGQSSRLLACKSVGRFLGEAPPKSLFWERPIDWLVWVFLIVAYHLPCRIAVLPGEMPEHDYHHRHQGEQDWPNSAYQRQWDLEAGCPGWLEPYTEVWGLFSAINHVFTILSELPPLLEKSSSMSTDKLFHV